MPPTANHYSLKPLCRSVFNGPTSPALRSGGWDIRSEGLSTIIYHSADSEPPVSGRATSDLILESLTVAEIVRCYHAHVTHLLRHAGLIPVAKRNHEAVYPDRFERFRQNWCPKVDTDTLVPEVRGHHRWTWEIEQHSGRFWLVPRLSLRYISAGTLNDAVLVRWLGTAWRGEPPVGINLMTGAMLPLARDNAGAWAGQYRGALVPIDPTQWKVTFSMENLRQIHRSQDAFYTTRDYVHADARDLTRSPFAPVLESGLPLVVPETNSGVIRGQHLMFGKGSGEQPKAILQKGLLQTPPKPVRLLVCAPEELWERNRMQRYVRYVLGCFKSDPLRQELQLPEADTVKEVWERKWGLKPYDPHKGVLTYSPDGRFSRPEEIRAAADLALQDGRTLIALVLLNDEPMPPLAFRALHDNFRGRLPAVPAMAQSITGKGQGAYGCFSIWANMAAEIAVKAGARPWNLCALPGVDERTVFVGLDLGHSHKEKFSQLSMTLVDHQGRLVGGRPELIRFERINENLRDTHEVRALLLRALRRAGLQPERLIVHRDGRFMEGETESFLAALAGFRTVSLVGIKKDAQTQFSNPVDGFFWMLNHDRALLVTSTQGGVSVPLEVELRVPGNLTLAQAVAQVFWLTRVYQSDLFQAPRLPVTTRRANNTAGTGSKVHLKSWAKGQPIGNNPL